MQKKERNASIDIFRGICAIMVVAIHTGPLSELGYEWWYFATQVFPRLGVPFFFCTVGYYYIGTLLKGQQNFFKTIKSLMVTYGIWSVIYFIPDAKQVITGSVSLGGFLVNCLRHFLFYGSREHFWFFPAVFFSLITATIFARYGKLSWLAGLSVFAYILGLLGCSYYEVGNSILLVSDFVNASYYDYVRRIILMGFPFFMLGYFLQKVDLQQINNRSHISLEVILGIGFLAEIFWVNKFEIQKNVYVTIFLYFLLFNTMLLLLKNPCEKYGRIAKVTRDVSNFMYYSHPLFMIWIQTIYNLALERKPGGTELFALTVISTVSVGYLLHRMDNKYLNKLYN